MSSDSKFPLKSYNSFHIDVSCKRFVEINSIKELSETIAQINQPWMVLGGGSNVLFKQDYPGSILKMNILGRQTVFEDEHMIHLQVGAGENWHQLVMWTVDKDLGGIENLALIPGSVGAAPIQNIGAYGVELKDVLVSLKAYDLIDQEIKHFTHQDCQFSYRDSIFKKRKEKRFIIISVVLSLTKNNHVINSSYRALQNYLDQHQIQNPKLSDIRDAVITIRQSKLPDPNKIGNGGSFFKNPIVTEKEYKALKKDYPDIPGYPAGEGVVKLPAAWLIDQCGWKGKRFGDAGVYPKQALVLVNYGDASGQEIVDLSLEIKSSVINRFGVELNPEVNIV